MVTTRYGIDLTDAIATIVDDMRTEDPGRTAGLTDTQVIALVREDLTDSDGRPDLDEVDYWVTSETVDEDMANAYRAVIAAANDEIDAAL